MRRKALKGVANTLCHMVDGNGRYPDDDRLAVLGSGTLVIDALTGRSTHNGSELKPPLELAKHMHSWLTAEIRRLGLEQSSLTRADVIVPYDVQATVRAGMRLWEMSFSCSSQVVTDNAVYHGETIPGRPEFGGSAQR
jgi:hypothetical protein